MTWRKQADRIYNTPVAVSKYLILNLRETQKQDITSNDIVWITEEYREEIIPK
jgi:hypothetical protein